MSSYKSIAGAAIVVAALLGACAGPAATPSAAPTGVATPAPTTGPTAPTGVEGNVDIHGSSTVGPISNAVAEDFQALNPNFSYVVGEEGTGDGFKLFFCVDQSDISDASRKIKADNPDVEGDEEATICANNGIEWVELKVAYDGLAVITHPDTPIDCLTFADLYALMGPEADTTGANGGQVTNWNDAEALAQELGSTTDLPDSPLAITAPGDESGTYDSFIEIAMGGFIKDREQEDRLRTPGDVYVASANDNVIIQGIAGVVGSLGFVGLAYAQENADTVKILSVDKAGDGTCVTPSAETVVDGTYPIARPLFIYPNLGRAAENAAMVAYVDFYLSDAGIANAADVGYVALSAEERAATRQAWEAAKP